MFPQLDSYILLGEKLFFVICAIFYLVFSVLVVKQTTTMSRSISDKFNSILITFSYVHMFFSIGLVLLTLFVL